MKMPSFIKHIEDCVFVNGRLICWDITEGKPVICDVIKTNARVTEEELFALTENMKANRNKGIK